MLLFLVTLGRWFEIRAQKIGTEAVERLLDRIPPRAWHVTPEGEREIPADQVTPGARLRVRPGERFPADGLVALGRGDVDESLLTGEPTPVLRAEGDRVLAGSVNLDGGFEIITTAVGAATVAGQIGKLLHQALWARSPVERLADRLAAWMVPTAMTIATGTFAFWTYRTGPELGLLHALSVLLIACPCALGLATPLTLWVALTWASETGAILRSTGALENLARVQKVCFDKTSTLTHPSLQVQAVACSDHFSRSRPTTEVVTTEFLGHLAAIEQPSKHPIGRAIVQAAQGMALPAVADFRALPGQGVVAQLNGTPTWVGSRLLMAEQGFALSSDLEMAAVAYQREGMRVVYAGYGEKVIGVVGLGETVRGEVGETVRALQDLGLGVVVLTGDSDAAGARWASKLGVEVHAEMRPAEKLAFLQDSAGPVAMVGDGLNDGPALAAAAVGIALSHGTDVAQSAAEVVLVGEDLRAMPKLIEISRRAMRTVRQNLAWSFFYNLIGVGLAMSGLLQPVWAATAMVVSSVLVTGNALRK